MGNWQTLLWIIKAELGRISATAGRDARELHNEQTQISVWRGVKLQYARLL